jgi:signal transduction histidine kinase/response regulator RpfG family c-di-GMP phosphodiesterase
MDESKVSILIVDDRPEKLLALEAVLEELGENIVRAYSGREALRHVLVQEFAVILLDVNMPDMDGFETAQLIRQRKTSAHVPIIFLTAMSDEMHVSRGYSLGAVDYILTPVVPQVLKSKVAVFVDLFRKSQQVEQQAQSLRRRTLQLQKLASASVAINAALSIDKMLQTITDAARDVIGAHQAITVLFDPRPGAHKGRTQSCASYSDKYASWRNKPLDLEPVAGSAVARSHTATRMTESELHLHPDWEIVRKLNIPPITGGVLAAPLTGRDGGNLGMIYLCDRFDGSFSFDDEAVLVQLAQMASIAIENSIFAEEREANRLKDEFLSTLSHELRTPLNAISGWVQLLKAESTGSETEHGLEVIERNVNAQTKLIEDLLDLSRITSGKLRLNARPTEFRPIVEASVEALRPAMQDKRIALRVQLDAHDAAVMGDPDRLQQVVWNLLSNAVKFTPAGGKIEVRLYREADRLRLSITDSGEGIDPEFLPHVFDRFRQADSTSSRRHGGLGIGLTIVQHIVNLHRGSVHAHSEGKGHGSSFTVALPIAAVAPISDRSGSDGCNGEQMPSLKNVRVLVVDDEPDAREVVAKMLRRCDAEVVAAGSVSEAIQEYLTQRPDVVVTDLAMPERDGFALLRELTRLNDLAGHPTPTIALTAYARPEDQQQTAEAGFAGHLAKPVNPGELIGMVRRCASSALMSSVENAVAPRASSAV